MNRVSTLLLQLGLVAVVVVVLPYKLFELDRYFVPKELVLHVVALVAALSLVAGARAVRYDLADKLLAFFLAWSVASALFATNYWLAQRAVALSLSSAVVFWASRRLGAAGLYRSLLVAAAFATVCAAVTGLAQAYGVDVDYFSRNRSPGGTFGNRNFVAHFCAIGLPVLAYVTVTSRRPLGMTLGSMGVALVGGLLVLTRSRAAWLAVAGSAVAMSLPLLASRRYWRNAEIGGRFLRLMGAAVVGAVLAIIIPNRLNWSSESPYLDSARGMVDYKSGSGRGRLAQYMNSMKMSAAHPLFGVGPGNWPVRYPRYAPGGDASLTDDGMTANPWPSSDWVAFVSERGAIATVALLGMFALLLLRACRRWSELPGGDVVLAKVALVGTITATLVVSLFDAALLLAAPAFLAWCVIGAGTGAGQAPEPAAAGPASSTGWRVGVGVAMLLIVAGVVRSAAQTAAITTVGMGGSRAGWIRAATLDPGSYRINMRVADLYADRGQCASSRTYARRAFGLFPNSASARQMLRRCG